MELCSPREPLHPTRRVWPHVRGRGQGSCSLPGPVSRHLLGRLRQWQVTGEGGVRGRPRGPRGPRTGSRGLLEQPRPAASVEGSGRGRGEGYGDRDGRRRVPMEAGARQAPVSITGNPSWGQNVRGSRPPPLTVRLPSCQQDKVRCFFCYGGLQSWEQGDDPWTEHAKWFPRCEFLLQTKGRDFVCSVQEACCHLLGSWDPSEEPEDTAPATPSDARGSQEWSAWSQCPAVRAALRMGFGRSQVQQLVQQKYRWAVPASVSASQLVADLLQEEDGGCPAEARAPVHMSPELPTPRREVQSEGAREPGARDAEEQLQRLREERVCKVCLDRTVCTVFVPCGHLVCAECAPALQLCPVCRAPIRSCVRTFLP
ncbi:baculoviral IAP repeat-containing protein 7 isoform X2 [Canis lupus dingo]|uniref:baculoviral IAP repeat-containing protein 7 isoform X2 n=1 Tax=Canis lupus dingo TaxID=286419 RepID=UPI000BAA0AB1|nr:baculoviral IAP repeat-containing protein 7 isoform X2 [Canis lupus dingo]|eukprot:XP_022264933.1 baculoviral IAP repeat-containing protein 7 isoform X2 [Canis lupus familiaris]